MIDDRLRAATARVSILQYAAIATFTVLSIGFWVLQIAEHAKFRGDGREQQSADARAARAAGHRLRPEPTGPRRQPPLLQHFDHA